MSSRAKRAWAKRVFTPEALTLREKQEILFATIFWFLCFEGIFETPPTEYRTGGALSWDD